MTMNSSGPISLAGTTAGVSIEIENGGNGTTQISLNDTAVRNLAGVPSGAITMPTNFYGKSNRASISYTYSASAADASLNLSSISGYSSGKSDITVTINGGVYLYATSNSSYGLNLYGGTSGDTLTIVNNGYIMGKGGDANGQFGGGTVGGPAVNCGFGMSSCTINNTNGSAYIGGGGGGGGSRGGVGGGGGAGGGSGGSGNNGGCCGTNDTPGGVGGGPGSLGANGAFPAGAGGGRIFPGTSAYQGGFTSKGGQAGGQGGQISNGSGPTGGGSNNAGTSSTWCGGGGGWGASGGNATGGGSNSGGTSGGKAVNLNGKSVTWTSGDTARVYGSVA